MKIILNRIMTHYILHLIGNEIKKRTHNGRFGVMAAVQANTENLQKLSNDRINTDNKRNN